MTPVSLPDQTVQIREATLDDVVPAMELLYTLGLAGPREPQAIRDKWQRLWVTNPACLLSRPRLPIGWVMEAEGRCVGFFGNIPRRYRFGERTLLVAVASMWGVEKPFRTHTHEMSAAYAGQTGADLFLVTTAIKPTARIFLAMGGAAAPQRDYDTAVFWVLDSARFLSAAFRKKGVASAIGRTAGYGLAPILAMVKRRPGRLVAGLEPERVALSDVGEDFDELWQRKNAEQPRLYGYRTALDIRWQFEPHEKHGQLRIIRCSRGRRLEGYAVLVCDESSDTALRRMRIVDLLVSRDDELVIDALLAAAHEAALEAGCHVLEAVGLPESIRASLRRFGPFTRRFESNPLYYKACTPDLVAALSTEDAWYMSWYDGDSTLA
jgi:hypothetical protein